MIPKVQLAALCLLGFATGIAQAQTTAETGAPVQHREAASASPGLPPTPSGVAVNRMVILLDPAHGGVDSGSRIGDTILEKDVTLQFAFRLRSLLTARGFTVVMTRDSDAALAPNSATAPLTLDERAGLANHARPAACLLLHATGSGSGVHLYSSELAPAEAESSLQPWLTAQAPWVTQSGALARQVAAALTRARVALVSSKASIRPVDSMTCPALVLELAPESGEEASINDEGYQQQVATAVAGAMVFWPDRLQAPMRLPAPVHEPGLTGRSSKGPGSASRDSAAKPKSPEVQP